MPSRILGQTILVGCLLLALIYVLYQPSDTQPAPKSTRRSSRTDLASDARNSTLGVSNADFAVILVD